MPTKNLLIICAGGHARVVLDAAKNMSEKFNINLFDDRLELDETFLDETLVHAPLKKLLDITTTSYAHIAVGDNNLRKNLAQQFLNSTIKFITIIHPQAIIAKHTKLEDGIFVAALAIIAPGTTIKTGCIINHGAIVDHDCTVGSWCHIAPHATLGGKVHIGNNCLIGSGATILPGITIADNTIVGSGAVVTKNILQPGTTIIGNPAK